MSEHPGERRIRRILVGLDASSHSLAALAAAADLAAALQVELHGVFVQDADLLSAADVSFVREVQWLRHIASDTDSSSIRRQMDAQAVRARRMLEEAATSRGVRFKFLVRVGHPATELLEAARDVDLILLGKASLGGSRRKLGSTAQTILGESRAPVMVLREGLHLGRPILTVYDGSAGAEEALIMSTRLAKWRGSGKLLVMVWADEPEVQRAMQHRVTERFGDEIEGLHFRPMSDLSVRRVAAIACERQAGVIIVGVDSPLFAGDGLQRFLNEVDQPVILVREPAAEEP